jgi:hypothetical protein
MDKVGMDHNGHHYEALPRERVYTGRYRIDDFAVTSDNTQIDLFLTHVTSGRHFVLRVPVGSRVAESLTKTQDSGQAVIGSEFVQLEGEALDEAKAEAHEGWRA